MLGLEMLDVALGVIFVFLLISLIVSAVNELVEAKLKLRAVDLEQGIRNLLNDPGGNDWTKKIYDHPLVYSLFTGDYKPADIRNASAPSVDNRYSRGSNLPTYIPAKNFSLALVNVLRGAEGGVKILDKAQDHFESVRNAIDAIDTKTNPNNEKLKQALVTIASSAEGDMDKLRAGIESWYNSTMDRVSGWYKRRVQKIVFAMGFAAAIILNADTIAIFSSLTNDRPLRQAIVANAKDFTDPKTDTASANARIHSNVSTLLQLGLPIGWAWKSALYDHETVASNLRAIPAFDNKDLTASIGAWLLKAFGWFLTGMAVSLGAPFWFDILNKIMVIRSTVKPHEKSPEEGSQDRQNK